MAKISPRPLSIVGLLLWFVSLATITGCNNDGSTSSSSASLELSGYPATQAAIGQVYSFTPAVAEVGSSAIIGFSIRNKPAWATFNTSSGRLEGTPTSADVGNYPAIVISASSGSAQASLAGFTITVLRPRAVPPAPTSTPTVTVQIGPKSGTVALIPGMTFGGSTLDPVKGEPIALKAATQLLTDRFPFQNQWSGGFGVDSDKQWPTQTSAYNWTQLDARINLILSTGRTPVITLCGVPAWMRVTSTDYFSAPQAIYFQAYAKYAAAIATRYPQVKYFLVWSEMKGFWNANLMRWDYEGYTRFYNDIYAALKAVSPTVQVGGPYVNMSNFYATGSGGSALTGAYGTIKQNALDVVTYWLANNQGADFLVVDGSVMGNNNTEAPADWYAANQYFSDVNTWLKQQSSLPIWWSEYYPNPCLYSSCAPYVAIFDHDQQNTLLSKTLLSMMPDVSVALKWTPDGESTTRSDLPAPYQIPTGPYPNMGDQSSVWSDTAAVGGGQGFPFANSLAQFEQYFSPGSTLYSTQVSNSNVAAYATSTSIALINQTSQDQIVQVTRGTSTQTIQLSAYQVYFNSMP